MTLFIVKVCKLCRKVSINSSDVKLINGSHRVNVDRYLSLVSLCKIIFSYFIYSTSTCSISYHSSEENLLNLLILMIKFTLFDKNLILAKTGLPSVLKNLEQSRIL